MNSLRQSNHFFPETGRILLISIKALQDKLVFHTCAGTIKYGVRNEYLRQGDDFLQEHHESCRHRRWRISHGSKLLQKRMARFVERQKPVLGETIWTTRSIYSSATRFGEISPLRQNFINVCRIVDGLLSVWQNNESSLAKLSCFGPSFSCCKWPNIEK